MDREPGLSVRLKLTLSYAVLVMIAGAALIAVVWVYLLRYVPDEALSIPDSVPHTDGRSIFIPGRSDLWQAFAPKAALMLAALLVFGLVGGWILAGRMLAPLKRITDVTRTIGSGSLSERIRLPGHRDEFRDLADDFDAMLDRLQAYVAGQERFVANASHELRTPLAITQTLLEVAAKDPNHDSQELNERLRVVNARAIELTQALLLLSRADQRSFTKEPLDLSLIAEQATETLLPLAERRGVSLETFGDVAPTTGSPALLVQMTTNLVHNAIVHNLEHGSVWVRTTVVPGAVVLAVDNTGELLDASLLATATEPFRRGTERVRGDQAGFGLGLAIVASIVAAHDGTLRLAAREGGGLSVIVRLPVASPGSLAG